MDNTAIFMEYAQSDGWIAIHFAQWLGVLLLFGGFVALTSLRQSRKRLRAARWLWMGGADGGFSDHAYKP